MLGLGMPAMLGYVATTLYLEGLGRPLAGVGVIAIGNLLNLALNWLLIYGSGDPLPAGAVGAALATTVARWVMLVLLVGYVLLAPSLRQFGPSWTAAPALVAAGQAAPPRAAVRGLAGPRDQRLPGPDADLRVAGRHRARCLSDRGQRHGPGVHGARSGSPRRPRSASGPASVRAIPGRRGRRDGSVSSSPSR